MKAKQTAFKGFDKSYEYHFDEKSDVLNNPNWESEFTETLKNELSLHECVKVQTTWRVSLKKKDDVESKPYLILKWRQLLILTKSQRSLTA